MPPHKLAQCDRNLRRMPNFSQFTGTPAVFVCNCGREFHCVEDEAEGVYWALVHDPYEHGVPMPLLWEGDQA